MNFCTRGVIFVLLAKLKCKLVENMWRFLRADMVDFRRPGHIYHRLSVSIYFVDVEASFREQLDVVINAIKVSWQ